MPFRSVYIYCIILSFYFLNVSGQQGNRYLTNFSTADYKASDQNWDAVQDSSGKMYFANLSGVLVYDGKFWKIILLPGGTSVFSLDKDEHDRIYVGGDNEFGFLEQDAQGALQYRSLSDKLKGPDKEFSSTWATHCIGKDVFFCSNEKIFWYHEGVVKAYSPDSSGFHTFFRVGNHLFVREFDKGFSVFENGNLSFVKGSEEFADKRVYSVQQMQGNTYIVATRNNGIYLLYYNDKNPSKSVFVKRNTLIDQWMTEKELYCGARLSDNRYAFGSLKDGMIITDRSFHIITKLHSNNGLQDDAVKNIFQDANNNLWLSLNFGIAFYEENTPITFWKKNDGIKGVVENIITYKGTMYAATDKGLLKYNRDEEHFELSPITFPCFALTSSGESLFIATTDGFYMFDGKNYKLLLEESAYSALYDKQTNMLYIGTSNNLYKTRLKNSALEILNTIEDAGAVRSIAVDANGNAAVGTTGNGVYVLTNANEQIHLTDKEGLPYTNENAVFVYNGKIYITSEKGIYGWIPANKKTVTLAANMNPFKTGISISSASQVRNQIWFLGAYIDKSKERTEEIYSIEPVGDQFRIHPSFLNRIQGATAKQFFCDSDYVYIGTNQGLFCYDLGKTVKPAHFSTIVSKAWFGNDTVNYIENYAGESFFVESVIPYDKNELHIAPAATTFFGSDLIEFSYYLEGKESTYRDWNVTNMIEYNNIHEGHYILHLKARDILGNESRPVTFSFSVSPPWFRTTWAYICYGLLAIGSVLLFVSLYTKRLKQRNINLENIITQRTKTIVDQKQELEHKNQEITDSINYAKRIQLSILPEIKSINQQWNDVFVFYQPKDIVSGDFYWYKKLNDHEFLIAIADCTGHGVPGGFMSMICSDKLHQAAEISTDPGQLLYHANNFLKDALKQGNVEGGTKDGMEIALLKINTATQSVSYSGANRFLWIIKKDTRVLEEIKATKASIASTTDYNCEYEVHYLQLQKGDTLYISSDGYPDQFGGPDGKKFMTKNFKQYLQNITDLPIAQQGELLRDNINNWMNGVEQVDDLLVIGVRL
ncbi:MAG: SpoIIE family protein phosphatase [Bacteroidetes bacterium]|nr:SpoIIE family protein phosphatase [Bacteroidota bacterium]